jgi:RHS repeat-associated protein
MSRLLDLDAPDFSLYWYRSRHYSTALGRFLQKDSTLAKDASNLYAAFGNNPLRFIDPLGSRLVELGKNQTTDQLTPILDDLIRQHEQTVAALEQEQYEPYHYDVFGYALMFDAFKRAFKEEGGGARGLARVVFIEDNPLYQATVAYHNARESWARGEYKEGLKYAVQSGLAASAMVGLIEAGATATSRPILGPEIEPAGLTPASSGAGAMNLQPIVRGGASGRGIGVLYISDAAALSPAELEQSITAVRDMDFQAGMAGGLTRQTVSPSARATANRVANIGRDLLDLDPSLAAGHTPDVAAGGNPIGVIIGIPRGVNQSWGGQWGRYQPGFVFEGFILVDQSTGQVLYPSMGLENPVTTLPSNF